MSLRIDTTACEGQDPALNFSVAVAMWATGIPHLKGDTEVDEFYVRYRMYTMSGNELYADNLLTYDQVSAFKGAHTNTPKKTPTQFNRVVADRLRDAATGIMNRNKKVEVHG